MQDDEVELRQLTLRQSRERFRMKLDVGQSGLRRTAAAGLDMAGIEVAGVKFAVPVLAGVSDG